MTTKGENTKRRTRVNVRNVLIGSVFYDEHVTRWFPFILLLVFFGLVLIANRYRGERIIRQTVVLQESLREVRSESAAVAAELMNYRRGTAVEKMVVDKGLGLESPQEPPVKLYVKKVKE